MDGPSGPGVTNYVSVSVDGNKVKTSASAYLTVPWDGRPRDEIESRLADAVAASLAVAAMAKQSIVALLESHLDDDVLASFVARVDRAAKEIAAEQEGQQRR